MSATLNAVESAAMELTDDERAELAISLIASIRTPAPSLHPAWEAEIAHRVADLESGRMATVSGEEALAEIQEILNNHPDPIAAFDSLLARDET
jgi:putative addiction module component (TIGR02574 family)